MDVIQYFQVVIGVLKERPDLSITAILLVAYFLERSERKEMTGKNNELVDRMHEQNKDTNELLAQIRFLLELLTKGRK